MNKLPNYIFDISSRVIWDAAQQGVYGYIKYEEDVFPSPKYFSCNHLDSRYQGDLLALLAALYSIPPDTSVEIRTEQIAVESKINNLIASSDPLPLQNSKSVKCIDILGKIYSVIRENNIKIIVTLVQEPGLLRVRQGCLQYYNNYCYNCTLDDIRI